LIKAAAASLLLFIVPCLSQAGDQISELKAKPYSFKPLQPEENLAYRPVGLGRTVEFLAIKANNPSVCRVIGAWSSVEEWGDLQLTEDRRCAFFTIVTGDPYTPLGAEYRMDPLFMLDGNLGYVRYIADVHTGYRSSADGKWILTQPRHKRVLGMSSFELVLYRTDLASVPLRFVWDVTDTEESGSLGIVRKPGGVFYVASATDGGFIIEAVRIVAEPFLLEPLSDVLLFGRFFKQGFWKDDINVQWSIPFIRVTD
jgi:hypothetical protein